MNSDRSSRSKSTKEDSRKATTFLPLLATISLLQRCFNIRNFITTLSRLCFNLLSQTDKIICNQLKNHPIDSRGKKEATICWQDFYDSVRRSLHARAATQAKNLFVFLIWKTKTAIGNEGNKGKVKMKRNAYTYIKYKIHNKINPLGT